MKHDIFLGGPWEKHAPFPYKTMIKEAFPDKNIFDPEEQASQKIGNWFVDNYNALESSLTLVALVPEFPFPGVGPEVGIFYCSHNKDPNKPLEEIVIIWPEIVKPDHGKKVAERMGYLVENVEECIARLKVIIEI